MFLPYQGSPAMNEVMFHTPVHPGGMMSSHDPSMLNGQHLKSSHHKHLEVERSSKLRCLKLFRILLVLLASVALITALSIAVTFGIDKTNIFSKHSANQIGVAIGNSATGVSVYAALNGSLAAPSADRDVQFDIEIIDKTNAFDGTFFTAPQDGLYSFTISVGHEGDKSMPNARLELVHEAGAILAAVDIKDHDQDGSVLSASRDVIIALNENEKVKVVLKQGGVALSTDSLVKKYLDEMAEQGAGYLTSISIFSYTALMKSGGAAFTVGLESDLTIESKDESFFKGLSPKVDLGNNYDKATGAFIAPKNGTYLFTSTVHATQVIILRTRISKGGKSFFDDIPTLMVPALTLNMVLLVELEKGSQVDLVAADFEGNAVPFQGGTGLDTAMSGFLYEPTTLEPVAFSATRLGNLNKCALGNTISPFGFDYVITNIGGDFMESTFFCRIPGVYFFNFMIELGAEAIPAYLFKKNNDVMAVAVIDRSLFDGDDLVDVSRSLVLDLEAGDKVYIEAKGIYINGLDFKPMGFFSGLLLQ